MLNNQSIFFNNNLTFRFNPFGGITPEELNQIIVPKFFFPKIKNLIESPTPMIIELVGKKGRGKTTHLTFLQQLFPHLPIVHLTKNNNTLTDNLFTEKIIFLDSIHHLSFQKRIQIYRHFDKVILTTHQTRILEYKWARQKHTNFYFRGLKKEDLQQVIENRIQSALLHPTKEKIEINEAYLSQLILTFKDNFRGILNHLYENFKH